MSISDSNREKRYDMKNIKILLVAFAGLLATGCYNDFDIPVSKNWTEEEVQAEGLTRLTIAEVKQEFMTRFGGLSNTGNNDGWSDTKSLKFGNPFPGEAQFESEGTEFWPEAADCYIKGKVISSDEQGNIYKSLYLWDGTAAIELRLSGTLYTTYKLDLNTMESTWVYVRLKDLYLGNFRMMLSIGDAPTRSYNAYGDMKYYANSNIEIPSRVSEHVLPGEACRLEADDILEVDETNYRTVFDLKRDLSPLGRLVRFKGVKIRYAGVKNQDGTTPAPMKNGNFDNIYPSWLCTDVRPIASGAWYRWGFSYDNQHLYGSIIISYDPTAVYTSDPGVYSLRTSGYSRFASKPVPQDGTEGTVLGIFSIYAEQSSFTGGSRDYAQYQITVNRIEDLDFPEESLLTEEWIEANTPASSYTPPIKDDSGESDLE